ncbi:hypothetical protein GCM10009720_18220 [Yaniella flava]|uniref:Sortase n=1 Tax=Yaniella flava TaxID=287930 RepID=A0ABN2UKC2_9MICC
MEKKRSIFPSIFFVLIMLAGAGLVWWGISNSQPEPAPEPEVFFDATDIDTNTGHTPEEAVLAAQQQLADVDSGVAVPDLDLVSPMITTGHTNGWLDLPDPPHSTFYDQTADIGSPEGASVIASHVDYGHGENAPFSALHMIDKGTPVVVKSQGEFVVYQTQAIDLYERQGLPSEIFRLDGEATAFFVTCSGEVIGENSDQPFYENNLVVEAEMLGVATISGDSVSIDLPPDTV